MWHYIGLLHKDAHSDYGVSFPDFPGCITAGAPDGARELLLEKRRVVRDNASACLRALSCVL